MPRKSLKNVRKPAALPEDDDAFVRLPDVLRVYPIGASSWHRGIAEGRFPKAVKLSPRVSGWRVRDIRQLLAATGAETKSS